MPLRLTSRTWRLACAGAGISAFASCGAAVAGNKKDTPAPRAAPHIGGFSMPRAGGGMPGGGVHMPGGLQGGAHLPSGMAGGGAHLPGSMASGAHLPGSMAGSAHLPASMGGGAHLPGSMSSGAHVPAAMPAAAHVPGAGMHPADHAGTRVAAMPRAGSAHPEAAHGGPPAGARPARVVQGTPAHGGGHGGGIAEAAQHPGEHGGGHAGAADHAAPGERRRFQGADYAKAGVRADPRLGGGAMLHTRGLESAMAVRREPRSFLRTEAHREVARDHAFVAQHAADFHTSDVRGFSTRELAVWRGGLWRNEWHYGRRGWWWDVGGVWYGYDNPVWPYPLVVAPLTVYDTNVVAGPDLSLAEAVPPDGAPPSGDAPPAVSTPPAGIAPLPPAPVGYYSCGDPNGTFPGVGACDKPWDLVDNALAPQAQ